MKMKTKLIIATITIVISIIIHLLYWQFGVLHWIDQHIRTWIL